MTQLMDPAGLKPINLCTAYQPQTSTLACRKIHYTIQPANNRPTPAMADKPCVAGKQSLLRYKLSQLFSQYTIGRV